MSREKPIILEGDINIHYKFINQLSSLTFNQPPFIQNLDNQIMTLKKHGWLRIDEIVEFVKIIEYFRYLKSLKTESVLFEWFEKIVIPEPISEITAKFDKKYQLKTGEFEVLDRVLIALERNKSNIKESIQSATHSEKLAPYLVDRQVHMYQNQESLLVRGGFNNALKAHVIGRSSGGFFYVVPSSVSSLKDERDDLLNTKEDILNTITKEFSAVFFKHIMFLEFINSAFDRFDHYQARVMLARSSDLEFILPSKDEKILLSKFIHPALHEPKPINIDFTKSILLLTGVNAGGKTMMLKSILSAVFMSKYLIPFKVDAHNSHIGTFKEIFAILDDPQNVKNDISTFAGRMVEFSKLFSKHNIIVGVDEIELGTDSDEAASLFKVILQTLKSKAKIVITTHHKRLAALLASDSDVTLAAALYDEEQRKPKYEFLLGTIGQSYAFETALRYHIPINVVNEAKIVYGEDKDKLNDLIQRSSQLELELKQKQQKVEEELKEIESIKQKLLEMSDQTYKELKSQKFDLHMSYNEAKAEVKKAIKAKIPDAHRHLNVAHEKIKDITIVNTKPAEDLKEGDRVKYNNSNGKILSIDKKSAYIELDNGMKFKCKINDLSYNPVKPIKQKSTIKVQKPTSSQIKLDLHGQRAEEAIDNLDSFISSALIAGYDELIIYHGIGSGKLSKVVKDYLIEHPKVVSFDDAPPALGGFGAKIVRI